MPLTLVATTGLEDEDQGLASGLFNTSQQVGGALGLAVLSTIATNRTAHAGGSQMHALVVMVSLLRKRHVARIEAQAASGDPVMIGA